MNIKKVMVDFISAASGIADAVSPSVDMRQNTSLSLQWALSGVGITGNGKVQGSINQTDWTDIDTVAITAAGNTYRSVNSVNYPFVRLYWDKGTSTAATVSAHISF